MERAAGATLSSLRVTTVRSIRQPVATLSGGQRQAVAVAKAVMWNSKLVMLDEPTAALGVAQTRMVLDLVRRLKDHGLAVMVISHNLNDVFEVADRVAILRLGRMVAQDRLSTFDRQSVVDFITTGESTRHGPGRPARGRRARGRRRGVHDRQSEPRVPVGHEPRQPVRPERRLHHPRDGGGLRPLLGEIDFSIGYVAAIGGIVAAELVQPEPGWPWWSAIVAALLVCGAIGAIHGLIITGLRMPAFVVTLAGYLVWFGAMIIILGNAGGVGITSTVLPDEQVLYGIVYAYIDPLIARVGLAVVVGLLGAAMWLGDANRRRGGLVAPPVGLTVAWIGLLALAGIAVVAICNVNRGNSPPIVGVPWVVPLVLVVLVGWSVLLERTRFGRHVYAVGGNSEAARRAGIDVARIRTSAFILCSVTAGIGGIIYCSQLGGLTTNINGGQLVLYAVAAAVIGGTSLFGGRGRADPRRARRLVIGAIYNGLYLLGLPIQWPLIVTVLVLLAAVSIDSLSRKGAGSGIVAHA